MSCTILHFQKIVETRIKAKYVTCFTKRRLNDAHLVLGMNNNLYLAEQISNGDTKIKLTRNNVQLIYCRGELEENIFALIDNQIHFRRSVIARQIFMNDEKTPEKLSELWAGDSILMSINEIGFQINFLL